MTNFKNNFNGFISVLLFTVLSLTIFIITCDDDESDSKDNNLSGACSRDDSSANFCIHYDGYSESNESDIESGCTGSWGGTWSEGESCDSATVGTCTLKGDAAGGADSAIIYFYDPTDAGTAENDVCGSDGTWSAI